MRVKYDEYFIGGKMLNTRAQVWCKSDEIEANDDGTFDLLDSEVAETLGFGSEIYVIDVPGMILFWDNNEGVAYNWTDATIPDSEDVNNGNENDGNNEEVE
ncbi:MAG: hypothetical protein J6S67_03470 [Methanobrevibacter sp.]|nr:hypothetical protein [Methanobrevibacter sp.]